LLLAIEEAERHEGDPGRLDFLFQVDHLATRLRRESERQLLFADRVPAAAGPEPATAADVVRVAVGHCADYQRIHVAELPPHRIDAAVADDLPHLLAELIDNGLALSPSRAQVRVSGCELGGGGLLIQVDDEGIGMDEALFADLNTALRDPTEPGRPPAAAHRAAAGRADRVPAPAQRPAVPRYAARYQRTGDDSRRERVSVRVGGSRSAQAPLVHTTQGDTAATGPGTQRSRKARGAATPAPAPRRRACLGP